MFAFIASSLLGVSPGSSATSIYETNKAAKAERKAREIERKIEERRRKREQMAQLREAQVARASAVATAVNTGTTDSSGAMGQASSIQSQSVSNIAYTSQVQTAVDAMGQYTESAAKSRQRAGMWEGIAALSSKATQFI